MKPENCFEAIVLFFSVCSTSSLFSLLPVTHLESLPKHFVNEKFMTALGTVRYKFGYT